LGAQEFLTDNSWGPAGDGFYDFQKEHQTIQELKKQVAELTMDLQKVNAQLATGRVRPTGGLELSKSLSHVA
jgi:hypothetical protein